MRVGLVARCDSGGLASQTLDLYRFLRPDLVLLVDLPAGQCRGDRHPERFASTPTVTVNTNVIGRRVLTDVADHVDVLVTVECLYAGSEVWHDINARCSTVLVANPELLVDSPATQVVLPTCWEQGRVPGSVVLPHPIDVDRVAGRARIRESVSTFLHVEAPAMADRNGSRIVAAALAKVTEPCTLIVRSYQPQSYSEVWGGVPPTVGNVRVVWDHRCVDDALDGYPDEADVLLLPRRYGGLSLVAQEAASLGIPSVMLNVDPQRTERWPGWRLAGLPVGPIPMRGGMFDVYDGDPTALAMMIDGLVSGRVPVNLESAWALEWAAGRSWKSLAPVWSLLLHNVSGAATTNA